MQRLKQSIFYLVVVAGTLLIIATLLSLIYDVRFWYLKVLDFPRIQMLLGLLVCLLLFVFVNKKWKIPSIVFMVSLVASIAVQARFILPYTGLVEEAVATAGPLSATEKRKSLSLLVANVWMKNKKVGNFFDMVYDSDPDVVLVMETNQWWIDRLQPLLERYPYKVQYPLDNTYGMALYSRLPLHKTEIKFLSHERVPSIHTSLEFQGGTIARLHAVHPVPPKPSKHPDNVGKEEVALLKVGKMVAQEEEPAVVAGDFNDVAWSKTSRLFGTRSRLRDVRIGRGLYNSFDATSILLRWPLDHVYVSRDFRVITLERLPEFGSDHFPILVRLALADGE